METTTQYKQGYEAGFMARQFRKDATERNVDVMRIVGVVCGFYDVTIEQLRERTRKQVIVFPRHVCIYFIRKYSKVTLCRAASVFGCVDHSTAKHAVDQISGFIEFDEGIRSDMEVIDNIIQGQLAGGDYTIPMETQKEEVCY
jgi:chromosomal replication initiation ATPase DnaA